MRYIIVIELESIGYISCKIQGLTPAEITKFNNHIIGLNVPCKELELFYEVEAPGFKILNILCDLDNYGYRVCSQAMVIENSEIGSRTIPVQKTVWTLEKN